MRPAAVATVLLLIIAGIYATWTFTRNQAEGPAPSQTPPGADRLANFHRLDPPAPVPQFTMTDMSGSPHRLSDLMGKVLLVNFWATWCAPCREEMPALDRLQVKLGGPAFRVVPISLDQGGADRVQAFLRKENIDNLQPFLDPDSKSLATFGLIGLPTTLLIGPDGREIGRLVGPAKWDSPEAIALIKEASADLSQAPH